MRYDPGVVTRVRPGAHGGVRRGGGGAQILVGGVGRGAQVCAPVRPCQPCQSESHHGHFESSPGQSEYILSQSEYILSQSESLQENLMSNHCPIRHRESGMPPLPPGASREKQMAISSSVLLSGVLTWLQN
jgi:hypothetical protein